MIYSTHMIGFNASEFLVVWYPGNINLKLVQRGIKDKKITLIKGNLTQKITKFIRKYLKC